MYCRPIIELVSDYAMYDRHYQRKQQLIVAMQTKRYLISDLVTGMIWMFHYKLFTHVILWPKCMVIGQHLAPHNHDFCFRLKDDGLDRSFFLLSFFAFQLI